MHDRIEPPLRPIGTPEQQLQAIYTYLYNLAENLNKNLDEIGGNALTDSETQIMKEVLKTRKAC